MKDLFLSLELPGGKSEEYDYGCGRLLLFENADLSDFVRLCGSLEKAGFALYDSLTVPGAEFRTYRRDIFMIVSFDHDSALRVISDEVSAEYQSSPLSFERKNASALWQFEVDHSLIDCGMCYALRLADGSFFMIDSPHQYSVNDDIRIVDFLTKENGGEKPVVAGWFFTHGHDDHIAKFMDILRYRSDKIEIRSVYYDFPPRSHPDSRFWDGASQNITDKFDALIKEHPEIKRFCPHSGQTFYHANARFTVLCAQEDIFPNSLRDYNSSSASIMAEVDGTKILFPGDSAVEADKVLVGRWGDLLSCDIVQVSHHGHLGTSREFYRLAGASCALFPVTRIKFDEELPRQEANRYIVDTVPEYHIASDGTVKLPLPYSAGNAVICPDETFEDFDGIYSLWCYEYTEEYKERLREEYLRRSGKSEQ